MGYHACTGQLEIWDTMVHVINIVLDESTDKHPYMYVVVLNQNTPVVRKTSLWGPGWRRGGTANFQFSSRGEQKIFKAAQGEQMFFQHMFPISGASPWW